MKNNVCFVVPHFGRLQNYFQLFLKTCEKNPNFHWIIFTDDDTDFQWPANVRKVSMTFEELKRRIVSKFDFEISLERPYKLCDFRPFYGYIFSDYLANYSHWGHCDTDTIMGNLGKFITDEMLDVYDKLFMLGHLAIYKNNPEINQIGFSLYNERNISKDILQNPNNCWFDEEWDPEHNTSINKILIANGKKIYKEDFSFNVSMSFNKFTRTRYVGVDKTDMAYGFDIEKTKNALYIWKDGELYRLFVEGKRLIREDYCYMHFQSRRMNLDNRILNNNIFKIVNDNFCEFEYSDVNIDNFKLIKKTGNCHHVQRLLFERLLQKVKKMSKFCNS